MKRLICFLLSVGLVAATLVGAFVSADPGTETDPVISLSYLNEVYQPPLVGELTHAGTMAMNAVYNRSYLALAEAVGSYNLQLAQLRTGTRRTDGELLLKLGDVMTLLPGTKIILNSGAAAADSDHLINVSHGTRLAAGQSLSAAATYMKDDSTSGGLVVTSESAAFTIVGPYTLLESNAVSFASRAQALKELGLFLGYANGFRLERTATRLQGLVVFIRIMGLEDEALAYTGTHPFTDVPVSNWGYRYVAYAYANGFTKGYTDTTFVPNNTISAKQYIAFMMRALGYEENADFTYANLLSDCVSLGLFTQNEINAYTTGAFARGRMVYFSYYSLFCTDQTSGNLLLNELILDGTITQEMADRAICRVVGTRLS